MFVVFGIKPVVLNAGLLVVVSSHTGGCSLAFSGQSRRRRRSTGRVSADSGQACNIRYKIATNDCNTDGREKALIPSQRLNLSSHLRRPLFEFIDLPQPLFPEHLELDL